MDEPSPERTRVILEGLRPQYEEHHMVIYEADALDAAVRYSVRYINDRFLPDKAIDLMDEAGALLQLAGRTGPDAKARRRGLVGEHP